MQKCQPNCWKMNYLTATTMIMPTTCSNRPSLVPPPSSTTTTKTTTATSSSDMFGFLKEAVNKKVISARVDTIISIRHYFEESNIPTDTDPLADIGYKIRCFEILKHSRYFY
ncbi:PREDICTED: uncharacterized protein LOC108368851 [Rhagoletis zephyria]|uniref:uncharacterized protein LOC108368851 n=1 Tax=Rhagoletis zephyria TaxID=28612 RepID=UPI0008113675|nr:PREDICTED: uncharacterized protein LOC108368851 [Rhagoletis zephyria]